MPTRAFWGILGGKTAKITQPSGNITPSADVPEIILKGNMQALLKGVEIKSSEQE